MPIYLTAVASKRQIPFLLTFEEWLDIWESSGHFAERGRALDRVGRKHTEATRAKLVATAKMRWAKRRGEVNV